MIQTFHIRETSGSLELTHFTSEQHLLYTFVFQPVKGTESARQFLFLPFPPPTLTVPPWWPAQGAEGRKGHPLNHAQPFLEGACNDRDKSRDVSFGVSHCIPEAGGMKRTLSWVIVLEMSEKKLVCSRKP